MALDPKSISINPLGAPVLSPAAAGLCAEIELDEFLAAALHAATNPGCQNAGDCKGTKNDGNCSNDLQCGGSSNGYCHNVGACVSEPPIGP